MLDGLKRVAGRIVDKAGRLHGVTAQDRALMARIRAGNLTYLSDR